MAKHVVTIREIYTAQLDASGKPFEVNKFGYADPFVIALEIGLLPPEDAEAYVNHYDFLLQIVNPRTNGFTLDYLFEDVGVGQDPKGTAPTMRIIAEKKNRALLTLAFDHYSDVVKGLDAKLAKAWGVFAVQATMRGNRSAFATTGPAAYPFHFLGEPYEVWPPQSDSSTGSGKSKPTKPGQTRPNG